MTTERNLSLKRREALGRDGVEVNLPDRHVSFMVEGFAVILKARKRTSHSANAVV